MNRRRFVCAPGVLVAAVAIALLPGCDEPTRDAPAPDSRVTPPKGSATTLTPIMNESGIVSPFDAIPDANGKYVYFTAIGKNGAGVFRVSVTGGTAVEVFAGEPFISPTSIALSPDGTTLVVADGGESGRVLTLSIGGGAPQVISATEGFVAGGLEIVGDRLFLTGSSVDGLVGIFVVSLSGGALRPVATGGLFREPSGIAVTQFGDIYVVDGSNASATRARILKVSGSDVSELVTDFGVGFPAGIALNRDETSLVVSALDRKRGTDVVIRVDLATRELTFVSDKIRKLVDPAGLHRAPNAGFFAFADSTANGTGTVFILSK